MDISGIFKACTLAAGVLAVIFIVIGISVPGWIVFDMKISMGSATSGGIGDINGKFSPTSTPASIDPFNSGIDPSTFNPDIDPSKFNSDIDPSEFNSDIDPSKFNSDIDPSKFNSDIDPSKFNSDIDQLATGFSGLSIKTTAHIGIWTVRGCVETGPVEQCTTMSVEKFVGSIGGSITQSENSAVSEGMRSFFGNFDAIRALMPLGVFFSICGFVLLCLFHRKGATSKTANTGILCAGCWALAALVVFSAITAAGQQNATLASNIHTLKSSIPLAGQFDMNIYFPWALSLAGLGAVLCVLLHISIGIWLIKRPTGGENGEDWHEFTNQNEA